MSTITKLKSSINGLIYDAKRSGKKSVGIEAWYPYYAGFTARFTQEILQTISLPKDAIILDPWNGSGTTTSIADQMGYSCVGFDINPVAVLVANAKLARPQDAAHIIGIVNEIVEHALKHKHKRQSLKKDPLLSWLSPKIAFQYRQLESLILKKLATKKSGEIVNPQVEALPPLASFVLLSLMRAARQVASIDISSNPTWIKPSAEKTRGKGILFSLWIEKVKEMSIELDLQHNLFSGNSVAKIGDSRKLLIGNDSIDLVFTSPPYCTRIDYAISTSFELAALRYGGELDDFRRAMMGSPLVRQKDVPDVKKTWPQDLRDVLAGIRSHSSKASGSYYYKNYWNYFDDCEKSLSEMNRYLKKSSTAILIVQGSYYKDIYVDLPQIYCNMARELDFKAEIIGFFDVKHHLTQINTRSNAHRQTTKYNEAIIAFEKR
jgi:DNA modification methylase